MSLPVIIAGAGGHARVLLDVLHCLSMNVLGYLAPNRAANGFSGVDYLGSDDAICRYSPNEIRLINGVGSIKSQRARSELFSRIRVQGYFFATLIHPAAVIASDVCLGEGCQIMAGAVLQPGIHCGDNVIINTRTGIDHDCCIGAHSHISVGATLSGDVRVGEKAHVGAGCTVIQGVTIGSQAVVAAGAVVIADVTDGTTVAGVPAREIVR